MLARAFFPKKPLTENVLTLKQTYLDPVYRMDNITCNQIRRHLGKLKLYKAPGPDTIFFFFWKAFYFIIYRY